MIIHEYYNYTRRYPKTLFESLKALLPETLKQMITYLRLGVLDLQMYPAHRSLGFKDPSI